MLRGFRVSAIGVLSVLFLASFSPGVASMFNRDDLDRELIALFKAVNYVYRRPQQMNVDATFGITIAEAPTSNKLLTNVYNAIANIAATLRHPNARYLHTNYADALERILQLCETTRRLLMTTVTPTNGNEALLHVVLNNPELWIRRIPWRRGALGSTPTPDPELTRETAANLTMQGTPKEDESDFCLSSIVRSSLRGRCRMPEACVETLTRDDRTRGYPLTHRLLAAQLAVTLGCREESMPVFAKLIPFYCRSIFQDLVDIEAVGFPFNTRDLMSEQVLLCGSEGYLEFTDEHYQKLILDWPHASGCFSSFGFRKKDINLSRRTSVVTDFGCDSHATGLAAATLALFIRRNVEEGSR